MPTEIRTNTDLYEELKPGGDFSSLHIDLNNGLQDKIILNSTPRTSHYFFDINEDTIDLSFSENYKNYVITGGGGRVSIYNTSQDIQKTFGIYSSVLEFGNKNSYQGEIINLSLWQLRSLSISKRPDIGILENQQYLRLALEYTNADASQIVQQLVSDSNRSIAYWDDAHNLSTAWLAASQGNAKTYFLGLNQNNSYIKNIFYRGNFRDYNFYNKGNGIYQINRDNQVDSITGLSTIKFLDKEIDVIDDIKGVFDQVTGLTTDSGKMFRLYNAAFARFPDPDGLRYWIGNFSAGIDDERAVSSSFLASTEFKERYGENITNETYVETLYLNVLNRELDQGGYDYWVGNLNNGIEERHEVLLGFSESLENKNLFTEMTGFG